MNKKFFISGSVVDLNQPVDVVMKDMQTAIDRFFPAPNRYVTVSSYKEINNRTFELEIQRSYNATDTRTLGNGFICDNDESLLTGLDIEAFQPFEKSRALVAPMIPWYNNMVYTPTTEFNRLWKIINETKAGEKINKLDVRPYTHQLTVRVIYAK